MALTLQINLKIKKEARDRGEGGGRNKGSKEARTPHLAVQPPRQDSAADSVGQAGHSEVPQESLLCHVRPRDDTVWCSRGAV